MSIEWEVHIHTQTHDGCDGLEWTKTFERYVLCIIWFLWNKDDDGQKMKFVFSSSKCQMF